MIIKRAMIQPMPEAFSPALIRATYQLTQEDFYEAQVRHQGWSGRVLQVIGALFSRLGS